MFLGLLTASASANENSTELQKATLEMNKNTIDSYQSDGDMDVGYSLYQPDGSNFQIDRVEYEDGSTQTEDLFSGDSTLGDTISNNKEFKEGLAQIYFSDSNNNLEDISADLQVNVPRRHFIFNSVDFNTNSVSIDYIKNENTNLKFNVNGETFKEVNSGSLGTQGSYSEPLSLDEGLNIVEVIAESQESSKSVSVQEEFEITKTRNTLASTSSDWNNTASGDYVIDGDVLDIQSGYVTLDIYDQLSSSGEVVLTQDSGVDSETLSLVEVNNGDVMREVDSFEGQNGNEFTWSYDQLPPKDYFEARVSGTRIDSVETQESEKTTVSSTTTESYDVESVPTVDNYIPGQVADFNLSTSFEGYPDYNYENGEITEFYGKEVVLKGTESVDQGGEILQQTDWEDIGPQNSNGSQLSEINFQRDFNIQRYEDDDYTAVVSIAKVDGTYDFDTDSWNLTEEEVSRDSYSWTVSAADSPTSPITALGNFFSSILESVIDALFTDFEENPIGTPSVENPPSL